MVVLLTVLRDWPGSSLWLSVLLCAALTLQLSAQPFERAVDNQCESIALLTLVAQSTLLGSWRDAAASARPPVWI